MPRPVRIEYPQACYHVMNRGRQRQQIFHSPTYYHAFLETLADAHERFGLIIHGYCLMGNHYHLLLQTPRGNLGRIMRHINGVYTQRYNRLKHTDGPLFRGRYKAILVETDRYLLPLSRYIHRNPIETPRSPVQALETYSWSSYPAYLNQIPCPPWLSRELIYEVLGHHRKYHGYRIYVEAGVDEEIQEFYDRSHTPAVLGDHEFLTWVKENHLREMDNKVVVQKVLPSPLSLNTIIDLVADFYHVDAAQLTEVVKGPRPGLLPRKVAMYVSQQLGGHHLVDIMQAFGLSHPGSVSFITTQIRQRMKKDQQFSTAMQRVTRHIMKHAS